MTISMRNMIDKQYHLDSLSFDVLSRYVNNGFESLLLLQLRLISENLTMRLVQIMVEARIGDSS